jgi:hypothetical protein
MFVLNLNSFIVDVTFSTLFTFFWNRAARLHICVLLLVDAHIVCYIEIQVSLSVTSKFRSVQFIYIQTTAYVDNLTTPISLQLLFS